MVAIVLRYSQHMNDLRSKLADGTVIRWRMFDLGGEALTSTAAAAFLLYLTYPIILNVALALGFDPDRPTTLSKVTQTT